MWICWCCFTKFNNVVLQGFPVYEIFLADYWWEVSSPFFLILSLQYVHCIVCFKSKRIYPVKGFEYGRNNLLFLNIELLITTVFIHYLELKLQFSPSCGLESTNFQWLNPYQINPFTFFTQHVDRIVTKLL